MQAALLLFLVALVAPLSAGSPMSESEPITQENFDLNRFMGKWYEVAVGSSRQWVLRHKGQSLVGTLEVQKGANDKAVSLMKTRFRHGLCKQYSDEYELTDTPGRFKFRIFRWNGTMIIDSYVVHTNYDEYALVVMYRQRNGGNKTTSVQLYGRSPELRDTLLDDFKRVVRDQGLSEDNIIIKQNEGECTPVEVISRPSPQFQRARRAVQLPLAEEEASGSEPEDTPLFRGAVSCQAAPDSGPCFGMLQRFYYNSSLMACQGFTFGGCMGNQNNFGTEKECLQSCRTEAACRLPIESGSCKSAVDLWAFDPNVGKCVSFRYSGCQGNGNKFYTQKECEEYCGVIKDDGEFLNVN
ncbi:protein AMBP isoform X1 [Denticeps clupeoides]|nr:protein AMBP isoform X1 [Denticeps clupeoides]